MVPKIHMFWRRKWCSRLSDSNHVHQNIHNNHCPQAQFSLSSRLQTKQSLVSGTTPAHFPTGLLVKGKISVSTMHVVQDHVRRIKIARSMTWLLLCRLPQLDSEFKSSHLVEKQFRGSASFQEKLFGHDARGNKLDVKAMWFVIIKFSQEQSWDDNGLRIQRQGWESHHNIWCGFAPEPFKFAAIFLEQATSNNCKNTLGFSRVWSQRRDLDF